MNITFLIGNGFDLNLGLNTRYTDVYEKYVETESQSDNIKKFKIALKNDMFEYKKWSDFEMGMAEYAANFETEAEFIECVRDFKSFMIEHIHMEELALLPRIKDFKITDAFYSSIWFFSMLLKPNSRDVFIKKFETYSNWTANFISFNYTSALDIIIETTTDHFSNPKRILGDVIHIHGRLDGDVILGVDNLEQFKNLKFPLSRKAKRSFIKPIVNSDYDSSRVSKALEMISTSSVICVYGLALGESDDMWRKALGKWLMSSRNNHLVYSYYETKTYSVSYPEDILEREEECKEDVLNRLGIPDDERQDIEKQIHIPVGKNIFDFSDIL